MKKILLIGELSEIVRSLNECLMGEFQVQLCSEQLENIQGMVKIIKPDLIIVCQIGIDELDNAIFDFLQEQYSKIPVLIVSTTELWKSCRDYCNSSQFDKVFRPITKNELLKKCRQMLHLEDIRYQAEGLSGTKKILIVDDNPVLLRNIKGLLEQKYIVYLATSGEQALKVIPQKQPDLVLLDYEMPGMDGKSTFEAMLEDEYAKDIPVIFLTSTAQRKKIYAVLKSVPAGYILKPPDEKKLIETIEAVWRS